MAQNRRVGDPHARSSFAPRRSARFRLPPPPSNPPAVPPLVTRNPGRIAGSNSLVRGRKSARHSCLRICPEHLRRCECRLANTRDLELGVRSAFDATGRTLCLAAWAARGGPTRRKPSRALAAAGSQERQRESLARPLEPPAQRMHIHAEETHRWLCSKSRRTSPREGAGAPKNRDEKRGWGGVGGLTSRSKDDARRLSKLRSKRAEDAKRRDLRRGMSRARRIAVCTRGRPPRSREWTRGRALERGGGGGRRGGAERAEAEEVTRRTEPDSGRRGARACSRICRDQSARSNGQTRHFRRTRREISEERETRARAFLHRSGSRPTRSPTRPRAPRGRRWGVGEGVGGRARDSRREERARSGEPCVRPHSPTRRPRAPAFRTERAVRSSRARASRSHVGAPRGPLTNRAPQIWIGLQRASRTIGRRPLSSALPFFVLFPSASPGSTPAGIRDARIHGGGKLSLAARAAWARQRCAYRCEARAGKRNARAIPPPPLPPPRPRARLHPRFFAEGRDGRRAHDHRSVPSICSRWRACDGHAARGVAMIARDRRRSVVPERSNDRSRQVAPGGKGGGKRRNVDGSRRGIVTCRSIVDYLLRRG